MHPNEFFPRDLLEDKALLFAYTICLARLSPEFQKRRIDGTVVELKPNEALVEVPLREKLISQEEFEEQLEILQQMDLAKTVKSGKYFIVRLTKVTLEAPRPFVEVDESHPDRPPITFEKFSERYLKQVELNTAPKNLENSKRVIKHANRHFGNVLLGNLRSYHLEEYKQNRLEEIQTRKKGKKTGKTTVNMDIRALKSALKHAIGWRYLQENPFRDVKCYQKEKKKRKFMTHEQFNEAMTHVTDDQLKKFFQLLVLTGMRRGEGVFLTWEKVNFKQGIIFVESTEYYRVKAAGERQIPISKEVELILKSLERSDPFVFLTKKGLPYKEDYVTKKFKAAVRETDWGEEFHLHCLRHTFATWLVGEEVSAMQIKDLLGHGDLKTTLEYARVPDKNLREAIETLSLRPI